MPAYALFDNIAVHDAAALEQYARDVRPVVERFGGRYLALAGPVRVVEGDWTPRALVMIEFPDFAAAAAWYDSPDYRDLKALRHASTRSSGVLFDGLPPAP